jgi:hypothetical protein
MLLGRHAFYHCFSSLKVCLFCLFCLFVCFRHDSRPWARVCSFTRFLDHTQRRTTFGRTPLDEWSARRRDIYLTTHNTHVIDTPGGIQTDNLDGRANSTWRLRPHGYWDRHFNEGKDWNSLEIPVRTDRVSDLDVTDKKGHVWRQCVL